MAAEKLANALSTLHAAQGPGKRKVFSSGEFTRLEKERLLEAGFLKEIINGWLMLSRPGESPGDTTTWNACFWEFARDYLDSRFGKDWIASAESSVDLLVGSRSAPSQVIVETTHNANKLVPLLFGKSILPLKKARPPFEAHEVEGTRVYPASEALVAISPSAYAYRTDKVIALLGSIRDVGTLVVPLLREGAVASARRLAAAYRELDRPAFSEVIERTMAGVHHDMRRVENPFGAPVGVSLPARAKPAVAVRVEAMWARMRVGVLESFQEEPRAVEDVGAFLREVDESYVSDAYHSLSIEGYVVDQALIESVRAGSWDPSVSEAAKGQADAMAAKGYWDAFKEVRAVVERSLKGEDGPALVEDNLQNWFAALFRQSANAGLIKPERLVGYRQHPVFIRGSDHVPVGYASVPDAMDAFFDCLRAEQDPRVRAVLGHFVFTYIHPFGDGNGRLGRFIMNAMLASGGFDWTVVPVERRSEYMAALESAAADQGDIRPFAAFVADCARRVLPPPRRGKRGEVNDERERAGRPGNARKGG